MNTLVPEQMDQDDKPEMVSDCDSDSGEEHDEDADEEGQETTAEGTQPHGIGSCVAHEARVHGSAAECLKEEGGPSSSAEHPE